MIVIYIYILYVHFKTNKYHELFSYERSKNNNIFLHILLIS
jgi:hypothetical protein